MSDFPRSRAAPYTLIAVFILASLLVRDLRSLVPPDEGRYAGHWMLVCWTGMALSVLAKGLTALVLPGAVLLLYLLLSGDRGMLRRLHPVAGLALFLAIGLPWFVLVAIRNPEQPVLQLYMPPVFPAMALLMGACLARAPRRLAAPFWRRFASACCA